MARVKDLVGRADAVPEVDREPLRRLTIPARRHIQWATALQAVAGALMVGTLVGIWVIADASVTGLLGDGQVPHARVYMGIGIVAGSSVVGFVATCAAYYLTHVADLRVRRSVRLAVAQRLGRLPLGWFDSDSSQKALTAFGADVETMHTGVAHGRMELVNAAVTPVPILIWLVTVDWRLALVAVIGPIVNYVLQQRIILRAMEHQEQQGAAVTDLVGAANEEMRDAVTLRVLPARTGPTRLLNAAQRLHRVIVDSHLEQESRGSRIATLVDPVFGLFLVLCVGFLLVEYSTLTPAGLVAFAVSTVLIASAPAAITTARFGIVSAALAAIRIDELLSIPPLVTSSTPRAPAGNAVDVDCVSFGHDPESMILRDVTVHISPNSFTAVVGPSGAGKSTLCSLIARHHDVDRGAIRIGGVDVRDIDPVDLAHRVTLLPQRAVLLRTTVRDNIRLSWPDAAEAAVIEAARTAHIHDRITALPDGYDTVIGDGLSLSSGEGQRIAIARALITDPEILILDEPTAHVDPESAAAIHRSLAAVARRRTVLLIAHQLDTIRHAEQIVVIEGGRVTRSGAHDELVDADGVYRRLWEAMSS
ncbi:ABC transporter ATP-binding protein [Gordonia sp. (in: high G+C Gram-positive bacteria)]|uniref:ABC transporter ATP-binding protein n=1 Tax=Gordonia sp. (in: high G+C Gram-positive bacteria) TaxID=84139 RepID=UPI003F967F9E